MCEAVFVRPSTIYMMERMQKKLEELMSKEEFKQFIHEINKEAFIMDHESLVNSHAELFLDIFEEVTSEETEENS